MLVLMGFDDGAAVAVAVGCWLLACCVGCVGCFAVDREWLLEYSANGTGCACCFNVLLVQTNIVGNIAGNITLQATPLIASCTLVVGGDIGIRKLRISIGFLTMLTFNSATHPITNPI